MSSSNRAPFQDITNGQIIDPRELKRQRDRKRYAKNKDEILKRRRQLRELKKQSTAPMNDENTFCHTHNVGDSVLTQLQFRATEEDVAPDVQQYASQDPHGSISIEGNDDESEWLHRCDAYHMNETRGRMIYQTTTPAEGSSTQFKGLEDIVGSNNVSLQQMGASSSRSAMGDPVTDLTNNRDYHSSPGKRQHTGQGWYARLSEAKKSEYLQRQRIARQKKKAAASTAIEVSQTSAATSPSSPCTPFSNRTNTYTEGICPHASPVSTNYPTPEIIEDGNGLSGQKWYAQLTKQQKSDHLMKMRVSWQQKKATDLGTVEIPSAHSGVTRDLQTPESNSAMKQVATSSIKHVPQSFVTPSAYSQNRRQHGREMYLLMTDEQREVYLRKNREYKKCRRKNNSSFCHDETIAATGGSAATAQTSSIMQGQSSSSTNNHLGGKNSDEEFDPSGIFEPSEQGVQLEDYLDTIQEEQTVHDDDDEECRIFSGLGNMFDSYMVTTGVPHRNQNDDPYDFVYHKLPAKHHVLKPVKDCDFCGAMKLQFEGPAFCCKKGMVKIVTPGVPQELRRLYTSQVDDDAKYFRKALLLHKPWSHP
uniref:Uncharacterized protein n=1 Tax=Avena sativa TaxID=4498 RepID=A0ACD6A071_AVESA